jgi:serine phosphatase RsbU (regulator of sigma subunit)
LPFAPLRSSAGYRVGAISEVGREPNTTGLGTATRPLRILLVEDDEGDALIVRLLFEETHTAVELTHVMTVRDAEPIAGDYDCALLDLGLPDASGLEGLERLRAAADDVAILVLTGMADEERGIAALAAGAQDYLIKGHVDGELLARSVRYAVERRRADAARRELSLAQLQAAENARLERGLLPTPLVSDSRMRIATQYVAGRRRALLGGDFFDIVEDDKGCLHAIIGDVSGHGPDEAAVGVCLRIAWRTLVLSSVETDALLPTLQQVLEAERFDRSVFSTIATLAIEPDRSTMTLRTAGHPSPLLLPAAGAPRPLVDGAGGPPLGVLADAEWEAATIPLEPGWSVLLYTDGLVEGYHTDGGRVGEHRLAELVVEARARNPEPAAMVRHLVERAEELNAGPLRDDVALVLLSA